MKGLIFIAFFIILISQSSFAAELTLDVGVAVDFEGYEVKLKNLRVDKAVVSVDGESAILEIDDEKILSGVRIKLKEIVHIGGNDGFIKAELSALYVCGDGECSDTETKANCCKDCGCETGFDCIEDACLVHVDNECERDSDCDDADDNTLDKCTAGRPKTCNHIADTICIDNSDCDDGNSCTTDRCVNNDCFNEKVGNCISGGSGDIVGIEFFEKESTVEALEQVQEEKESFWKKLIKFFKGVFSKDS